MTKEYLILSDLFITSSFYLSSFDSTSVIYPQVYFEFINHKFLLSMKKNFKDFYNLDVNNFAINILLQNYKKCISSELLSNINIVFNNSKNIFNIIRIFDKINLLNIKNLNHIKYRSNFINLIYISLLYKNNISSNLLYYSTKLLKFTKYIFLNYIYKNIYNLNINKKLKYLVNFNNKFISFLSNYKKLGYYLYKCSNKKKYTFSRLNDYVKYLYKSKKKYTKYYKFYTKSSYFVNPKERLYKSYCYSIRSDKK